MTRLVVWALAIGLGPLGAGEVRAGQTTQQGSEKLSRLNRLADRRDSPPPQQIREVIASGLADDNEEVQLTALWALSSRVAGARFDRSDAVLRATILERPTLAPLRALVLPKVTSPSHRVRIAALAALINMDWEPSADSRAPGLSNEVIALLVSRYRLEQHPGARSEIVKSLAFDGDAEGAEPTIAQALDDPSPIVVQFAIVGVERHKMASQLPKLAELLGHESPIVRTAAAGVMGTFKTEALPFLPRLKLALAAEQEIKVRFTMQGAIAAISPK